MCPQDAGEGAGQGGGRRRAFQRGEQHEAVGRREKRTQVRRQGLVEETPGGHSHGLLAGPEGEALILGTGYSSWGHFLLSAAHLVATCILTGHPGAGVGQSGGLGSGQKKNKVWQAWCKAVHGLVQGHLS